MILPGSTIRGQTYECGFIFKVGVALYPQSYWDRVHYTKSSAVLEYHVHVCKYLHEGTFYHIQGISHVFNNALVNPLVEKKKKKR